MKAKIISILVVTLLIATALPAIGIMNISQKTKTEPNDPQPAATKTGYLSVPAAAFVAEYETTDYDNFGSFISGTNGLFCAPLYLPHEATITKVTFYWEDTSMAWDGYLALFRYPLGGTDEYMADTSTSGSSGSGVSVDNTINNAKIDNTGYSYFLWLSTPGTIYDIKYRNALIEYTYETGVSIGEDMVEPGQTQVSQGSVVQLYER